MLLRLLRINTVLYRHGLDEVILATRLLRPVRFVHYLLPWNWVRKLHDPRSVRLRKALEELGPIFVKFGQILSVRRDLLSEELIHEFAKLQDSVPPFPGIEARRIVEQAYGHSLDEVFASFDETPLASASIAQVHAARLRTGEEVIVKVVRPGIRNVILRDVALMRFIADRAERYWPDARRLRPKELVEEFQATLLDELDLLREAASASQLRRNFEDSALLYIPEVYWPYTRREVMVMERISGVSVSEVAELRALNVNLQMLAERGVEIFFTQVFVHNFFHADMHPGNIFVDPDLPDSPRYVAVDFGIVGSLSPQDQRYLAENFVAFFNRDYRRVAELHLESGWVPRNTRVDQFESAIRSVCEPIFERPLKEISFGHLLVRLFQTARRFNMEVQPQLVLLQKTLLNIEGLGRQLYPELDLWKTAKPFLEQWMKRRIGTDAAMRELRRHVPRWGELLPRLPTMTAEVLEQARVGTLTVQAESRDIVGLRQDVRDAAQRLVLALAGAATVICGALAVNWPGASLLGPLPWATWLLGGLGIGLLAMAWTDRNRG
ncbi:MAG: ubiquinone biosynthesis regulatory protein kinase UbiB [Pseudomonadota bacterium]